MGRLGSELQAIDSLNARGSAPLARYGVLLALLGLAIYWPARALWSNAEGHSATVAHGPLSPYTVASVSERCRSEACRVTTAVLTRYAEAPGLPAGLRARSPTRVGIGVPVGALTGDATALRVWIIIDGLAIPVLVAEAMRSDHESVIHEQSAALGLPIREDDWRALSASARRTVFLAARARGDGVSNTLLIPGVKVIVLPDPSLRPGAAVRTE